MSPAGAWHVGCNPAVRQGRCARAVEALCQKPSQAKALRNCNSTQQRLLSAPYLWYRNHALGQRALGPSGVGGKVRSYQPGQQY